MNVNVFLFFMASDRFNTPEEFFSLFEINRYSYFENNIVRNNFTNFTNAGFVRIK